MFQQRAHDPFVVIGKNEDLRFRLPGYGRPLDFAPFEKNIYGVENRSLFPSALDDRDISSGTAELPVQTLREIEMVKVMEQITDIPEWWKKISDPDWAEEWRDFALNSGRDITNSMADWIIAELQYKAMIYDYSGSVGLYNGDITKSDTNVPSSLVEELRTAAKVLEHEHPDLQFYYPGGMNKQRDLLPMALYPLVYGRSRILPNRLIPLDEALQYAGKGEVIPVPRETGITSEDMSWRVAARADIQVKPYSRNHQVLPSDWELGDDGRWRIASYINNLHPVEHRNIYKLIEDAFNCLIPQWNSTITPLRDMLHSRTRIEYHKAEYYPVSEEVAKQAPQIQPKETVSEYEERYVKWRTENYKAIQPDVGEFRPWAVPLRMMSQLPADLTHTVRIEQDVELNRDYKDRGLQVITRILGVDLTPEEPYYKTDWHVECQMNEHVCAVAYLTFSCENMEDASMEFRNMAETETLSDVEHENSDFVWLRQVYGLDNGEPAVQCTGSIRCTVGRTVMFPSTVQHRLVQFQLTDKTKPGNLRALVFYLVDPNIRIISTANVPPQRLDWTMDVEPQDGESVTAAIERVALSNRDKRGPVPMSLNEAIEVRKGLLGDLYEFMKYQHVSFESNVLVL